MAEEVANVNRLPRVEELRQARTEEKLEENKEKGRVFVAGENNAADANTPPIPTVLTQAAIRNGRV
jgi:hypothetical protein